MLKNIISNRTIHIIRTYFRKNSLTIEEGTKVGVPKEIDHETFSV